MDEAPEVPSHHSRVEHWRHVAEIVALSIATLWGIYVFVYQERIKPATAPPDVTREIRVEHEITAGGKELVRVDASFKNIGESEVQIDGIVVNAYGVRYGPKASRVTEAPMDGIDKTSFTLTPSTPKPLYSFFDEWPAMGSHKDGNLVVDPGLEWHESFAFAIPAGAYDATSMSFYYCISHPTSRVWPAPRFVQRDGTSMWRLPAEHDGLKCGYQRSGLIYPL